MNETMMDTNNSDRRCAGRGIAVPSAARRCTAEHLFFGNNARPGIATLGQAAQSRACFLNHQSQHGRPKPRRAKQSIDF